MPVSPLPRSYTLSVSCCTIHLTKALQLRGHASLTFCRLLCVCVNFNKLKMFVTCWQNGFLSIYLHLGVSSNNNVFQINNNKWSDDHLWSTPADQFGCILVRKDEKKNENKCGHLTELVLSKLIHLGLSDWVIYWKPHLIFPKTSDMQQLLPQCLLNKEVFPSVHKLNGLDLLWLRSKLWRCTWSIRSLFTYEKLCKKISLWLIDQLTDS